ncbi:glutamine synthetase-like [Haliotis rubra]|uniref:glutamine synthetase-like n=1 Tax=Haliotis rubra TaxID=36100 RepID=UPI001EE5A263|nr:glutamine synthetase-like [Haliotis rubra]
MSQAMTLHYDFIRFVLCDINGTSRGQLVPIRNATQYFQHGIGIYQGILRAVPSGRIVPLSSKYPQTLGNIQLKPSQETLHPVTWMGGQDHRIGQVICETTWDLDASPQTACPRYVARKQIERLNEMGYDILSGVEVEFMLFDQVTKKPIYERSGYCSNNILNKFNHFFMDLDVKMQAAGVDIDRFHVENSPGKFEAVLKPKNGIHSPDMVFKFKEGLLEIADQRGYDVSFMRKTELGIGASAHFNFSILKKDSGENVFYDDHQENGLSDFARYWIAGLQEHRNAVCAVSCPDVTSYRVLHNHVFAPSSADWKIDGRGAMLRVKKNGNHPYIENRLPPSCSNPYLILAMMIAAGLDGVINKLDCHSERTASGDTDLPKTLSEALVGLESDSAIVEALGEEAVAWFVEVKREGELKLFKGITDEDVALQTEKYLYF